MGEPLRVGAKVVFTGGDEAQRRKLEERAEKLGVRVMGGVSRQTAILVSDGQFFGRKAAKAEELGTRVVHPDEFEVLLAHLQPPVPESRKSAFAADVKRETGARSGADGAAAPNSGDRGTDAPGSATGPDTPKPAAVRAWAAEYGLDVGARGRLPQAVIEAYEAAQRDQS